jgi:hypothetical protein
VILCAIMLSGRAHCTHSSGPPAVANALAEKVTYVSLSLGFDHFILAF